MMAPPAITTAAAATVTQSVTSTATSNSVLVVLVEDHNVYNAEPASLTWNGKTLTRAIQQDLNNGTYRGSAIYYCFNPPVGTANVSVTVTGANQTWISAFTLSGVDTNIPPEAVVPPLTGSDGENATTNILQFNVVGVKAGAWAVLNSTWANDGGGNPTITGTGGTDSHSYSDNNSTPVTSGYVSGLSAGTDNFQCQWFPGSTGNQKANFAGAIFSPFSAAGAAPLIIVQPQASVVAFTNVTVKFSVVERYGALPVSYQWYTNNTASALSDVGNLSGSASNVLTIANATLANAGGYTVVVTNLYGSVTSSVANLSIVTPNAYESAVLTNAPFAFYTFSETNDPSVGNVVAQDSMGYFSGTYGVASSNGFDGIAGPRAIPDGLVGFPNTNIALGTVVNLANSYVTLPAFNLNLNSGGGTNLTITAWINPQGPEANGTAIVVSRSGSTTAGLCYENVVNTNGSYRLGFNWNNDGNAYGHDFGLTPPTNTWSLVALVVSPTNVTLYLINTNGFQSSAFNYVGAIQTFAGPTLIGSDSFGTGRNFNGSIDEVALFGQPLSESQVVSLYSGASGVFGFPPVIATQPASQRVVTNTAATFSVAASGFPAIGYQWYKVSGGVTNALANATNATYTTAPVLNSDSGTGFLVVVSNQVNTVTSSTAILTAGHLVASSGYLIDNQYYGVANDISILYSIYPGSGWLAANAPSKTEYLNKFDDNEDLPTNSAQQIYGWFTPPVSGDYVFFMTADDAGTLWLSTNSSPANVYQIAQAQGYMIDRDWTCLNTACTEYLDNYATGEWRSDQFEAGNGNNAIVDYITTAGWLLYPSFNSGDNGIALVAGTKYYIELDTCQLAQYNAGQCAAVTYKLAGSSDPASNSPSLLMGTNISALVPDALMTPPHPVIGKITMSGSNMILSGSNGLLNAVYNVLSTTNVATPLTNWTVTATGVFNVSGNFSITNAIVPGMPQTFYLLQQKQ
jgi:hypothetical protein